LTNSYYDVVVLGMELGPLAAGALLARRGFRVLVVGQGSPFERYSCYGYTFTRRPFLLTAGQSPVVRRIMDEISVSQVFQQICGVPRPGYQVVLPDARIDVHVDPDRTSREIGREIPETSDNVEEVLRYAGRLSGEVDKLFTADLVLPPETFFERREFVRAQVQNPFFQSREADILRGISGRLGDFLDVPVRLETAGAEEVAALLRARIVGGWLFGCMAVEGGRDGLKKLLADRIVGQGGDVQHGLSVTEVVISRGKVAGVRLSGKEEPTGCQMIFTDLAPREIAPFIEPGKWPKRFRLLVEDSPEPILGYGLNLGVDPEVIPEAMAGTVLVSSGPGLGDRLLRLERVPQAEDGKAALNVSCAVPLGEEDTIGNGVLRDAILDRVRWLVPFLDKHLKVVHSPFDGFGPLDLTGEAVGDVPPVPRPEEVPRWLLRRPLRGGALGFEGLHHRTGINGLFLSGSQVVSGLGAEGELLAGWGAARIGGRMDPGKRRLMMSMRSKVEI
jgi:hypothetical protein